MKKLLSLMLVFSILISLIPVAPVDAAEADTTYKYTFNVRTKNSEHAGTGDNGNMGINFLDYGDVDSGYGGFGANTQRQVDLNVRALSPWRAQNYVIWLVGSDEWEVDYVDIWLPKIDGTINPTQAKTVGLVGTTKNRGRIYFDISDVTKRKFTSLGTIDNAGGEFYLNPNSTGSERLEWNKMVTDQYGTYDIMKYYDEAVMNYSLSNDAVGRDWVTFQAPTSGSNFVLDIDRKKLHDALVAKNLAEVSLTYQIAIPARTTNANASLNGTFAHTSNGGNPEVKTYLTTRIGDKDYYYKNVTYTFYRSIYDLGNANISQTPTYFFNSDNQYLNRNFRDVTITVEPTNLHKRNITQEEKTELITNFQATPALYLGNSTTTKITDLSMTKVLGNDGKPNGTLKFTGTIPMDISSVDSEGIRLQLSNVSTYLTKGGQNQAYNIENPTAESATAKSFYFSTHKVDTKSPTVKATDQFGVDLAGANALQNNIKTKHEFYMVASETIYSEADVAKQSLNQNYFKYELFKKVGDSYEPSVTRITNYDGTGNTTRVYAPISTQVLNGVSLKLSPAVPTEGEFKLRMYGWDKANNLLGGEVGYAEIENIKFDNQAPRVTITETANPQDGQLRKRNDYTFEMEDLQQSNGGWSRTYYTFINGTGTPTDTPVDQIQPISQELSSTEGVWAFIDSKEGADTAIITVPKGQDFDGNLYYFTIDSLGNDSRNEQSPKYHTKQVKIYNGNVTDPLITEDASLPKESFNISFDTSNPNIEVSYRWVSHPNNWQKVTQNFRVYDSSHNVGASLKRQNSGTTFYADGKYTLEYVVTDTRSGNSAEFSKEYIYDYYYPTISYTVGSQHDHFKSSHQFNVKATDASGLASAYYYLSSPGTQTKIAGTSDYSLTLTTNDDDLNEVNQTLTITNLPTGAYSVVVVAVDYLGHETKQIIPYFGMRSSAPTIDTLRDEQSKRINGIGVTTDGTYSIYTKLTEPHVAWTGDSYKKYQNPVVYASTDGQSTENGVLVSSFNTSNSSGGVYTFTLNSPVALVEGLNTIYFRYGLLNHPADTAPEFITDAQPVTILYDSKAPIFELPDYSTIQPTNGEVTATIVASDAHSGIGSLTVPSAHTDKISVAPYANGAFIVTISENVSTNLTLTDGVGNSVLVPIAVSNIDKDAPEASASSDVVTKGARTDGFVTVDVSDINDTTVSFALVKDPTQNVVLTEEDYELFDISRSVDLQSSSVAEDDNGIKHQTFMIDLKGLDGSYAIGIKAVDAAGNVIEKVFYDAKLNLVDAEASIANVSANPATTKTTSTVTVTFNVPVTIMPNSPDEGDVVGRMSRSNELYRGLLTTSEEYVMSYEKVITNNDKISLYVQDEVGRDSILEFTPDVEFVTGFDITGYVEKNGQSIANGGYISYVEGDELYYVVYPNPAYAGQYFFVENAVLSGLEVDEEQSVIDESFTALEGRTAYSLLVFEALRDGKTTKSAYFETYTAEGFEEDRLEEEYIAISVVDESAPAASVTYSTELLTNQNVTAMVSISDPQSGISKLERSYDGGSSYTAIDSIVSHNEVFEQNGTVYIRVTNRAGLVTVLPVTVSNIDKTAITENRHYTVSYTYENYLGHWVPIEEGKSYRRVMATVTFIGNEKTLSMTNNNASLSRILTEDSNTFTFQFKDTAGNTASKDVSYSKFDNKIGETSYVLSTTAKTNKNIFATITITDASGEIAYAEVKKGNDVYPFVDEPLGNEYVVELDSSGTYYVTAYDNAGNTWTTPLIVSNINKVVPTLTGLSYSIPPETITLQSVNVELTKFSKDIRTITVTGVEPVGTLTANDIVHLPGTKAVRFRKNGTVTVNFVDDYGNEGSELITVSNIVSTPPQIAATATLAEDKLSVDVTFDHMRDQDGVPLDLLRNLKDLTVTYRGYEYYLVTEVRDDNGDFVTYEDTVINVRTNGEHVFTITDQTGLSQKILLNVQGIDVGAPKVKEVRWTYKYLEQDQSGEWVEKQHQNRIVVGVDTSGNEAGYVVGIDKNPTTNQDVQVTVITDKDAKFVGGNDGYTLEKSINYRQNGLYNFNLEGRSGDYSSYGVDIGLIDKVAPELKLINGEELIFIEGMTPQKDASIAYDKSKLIDFEAWDTVAGKKIDLKDRVKINYAVGGRVFNPDNINANEFVRSNPYYIDYSVRDDAGNVTTIRRTVRLVGLYDTIALVNGKMPDSSNVATAIGDKVEISLKNFAGISYARYAKGIFTQGQMKTMGTVIKEKNGVYTVENLASGWYTFYIQTDKRDYFNISVYVENKGGK